MEKRERDRGEGERDKRERREIKQMERERENMFENLLCVIIICVDVNYVTFAYRTSPFLQSEGEWGKPLKSKLQSHT